MPVAEGLRDAARERDVAAAVNELAAGSGRGADPDLLRVVGDYFCSRDRECECIGFSDIFHN